MAGDAKSLQEWHFHTIISGMKTSIDAAGRIVVPKPLRQLLGLRPGVPLELRANDGRLEIEVAATPMRLRKRGKGLVAVPDTALPELTAEMVRDTLERMRR
jgi:AbrB family looped-hinge helix DNA binding protein